ncbi:MAG: hypothetical protein NC935_08460, partial [Candidatus Omnitrophica bacterium]|nr:hypothetical protein [Candidatus Omnitrophota bacterium]
MKTRIFKTKFWLDSKVRSLTPNSRLLFIYLLTNPFVSLTSYYEIDNGQIRLDLGLNERELKKSKEELEKNNRVFFYNNWVFIPNLDKHNPYWKSPKTKKAYEEELKNIPKEILDYFKRKIDSTIYSTPKTEIINNKIKIINNNNINNNIFSESNSQSNTSIHSKDNSQRNKNNLNILSKDKIETSSQKKEFGNKLVNFVLEEFKKRRGFYPTDEKPRQRAWNLVQRVKTFIKLHPNIPELINTPEKLIERYFIFLSKRDYFGNIENLYTVVRKLEIYFGLIEKKIKEEEILKRQ